MINYWHSQDLIEMTKEDAGRKTHQGSSTQNVQREITHQT